MRKWNVLAAVLIVAGIGFGLTTTGIWEGTKNSSHAISTYVEFFREVGFQDNPPFYGEMPFRIVDGRGELVPEVIAKIVEAGPAHEARRYLQQPVRLRGILIRHGVYDTNIAMSVHRFVHVLIDLGIEHEYVEEHAGHCGPGWEKASLKYMSDNLVFEDE